MRYVGSGGRRVGVSFFRRGRVFPHAPYPRYSGSGWVRSKPSTLFYLASELPAEKIGLKSGQPSYNGVIIKA